MKKKFLIILLGILFITGCASKEKVEYVFSNDGTNYQINDVFDKASHDDYVEYSEVASCAFDGLSRIYTYESYEITTYEDGNDEKIYSIYFLTDSASTKEGLKLYDSYDDMINLYGEDYNKENNLYTYTDGNTNLNIIIDDNTVSSIEYSYID